MRRALVALAAVIAMTLLLAGCSGGSSPKSATITPSRGQSAAPTARTSPTATGPAAIVEPKEGPPATEVSVQGTGWPAGLPVVISADVPEGATAKPYATVTARSDGTFDASFLLASLPDGSNLKVGRLDLIVRSGSIEVRVPYQVDTPRPVRVTPGGGGGG